MTRHTRDLHVLHVITGLGTGGAETSLLRLIEAAGPTRHTVVSLLAEGPVAEPLRRAGATVHALGVRRGNPDPLALARLARIARNAQVDVIQGWMYHANLAATLVGAWTRLPVLWAIRHALDAYEQESARLRAVIRCSAAVSGQPRAVLYNSQRSAAQHAARGFATSRAQVLPNGFAIDRYAADPAAGAAARAALGVSPDAPLIGLIARADPLKDHATFLHAAALLQARLPHARFLLAGLGTDAATGPVADALRTSAITSSVLRLGERRDVSALMNACSLVTLTSISEGFPNVIGEAMACERPCVVTDVGDAAALVGDGGLVVPPRSPELLADAWHRMLSQDHAALRKLGAMARARIEAEYTIQAILARYETLWAAAAGRAATTPALREVA